VICDRGDIAIVPFPFVEMTVKKMRPALVLSKHQFNEENGNTVLAMITTAKRSSWPSDIALKDASTAGLRSESYVRWKVFTLPNDLVQRKAGTISVADARAVNKASKSVFP
jgi:mRNA interferase MazF